MLRTRRLRRRSRDENGVVDAAFGRHAAKIDGKRAASTGGRSSGVALQWEISNHLMRLGSKALVVSNEEKSWNTWQVGMEKVNEIKPLMNASRV